MNIKEELRQNIVNTIPRLLTQLDRDPLSPTFGCFDRNFWHYKIRDFPSFVLQQNTLSLALLYKGQFKGNFCYNNPKILSFIKGGIDFWCKYQHKSGGFDEYWPNEDGYPPLVFSFFSTAKSYRGLKLDDKRVALCLEKAYHRWLKHEEKEASNQEIAGLAAVYEYYLIKKSPDILKNFNTRLNKLLKRQVKEGWFPEYGGADIGYSSVSLFYLVHLAATSNNKNILRAANSLVSFLKYFIHPDGTCGGEYGSRNTEYFLLGSLPFLAKKHKDALEILIKIKKDLNSFDDRYLFHYIFLSYIYAFLDIQKYTIRESQIKTANNTDNFCKYFDKSGLFVKKGGNIYFIVNLKKGGTFKIFYRNELKANDCGYRVLQKTNCYKVTSWINDKTKIEIKKNKLKIETGFFLNKYLVPSPLKHIGLRLLAILIKNKLISPLKKLLIFQNQKTEDKFIRTINLGRNKMVIHDRLQLTQKPSCIFKVYEGSIRFVPSSNFFNRNSIEIPPTKKEKKVKFFEQESIINF